MNKIPLAIMLVALSGCVTVAPDPCLVSMLPAARANSKPTECSGSDCPRKWSMAQVWIAKHSTMKIQTATDSLIQTYGSLLAHGSPKAYLGWTITKTPLNDGRYRIEAALECASYMGCEMKPEDAKVLFYYYLNTGTEPDCGANVK